MNKMTSGKMSWHLKAGLIAVLLLVAVKFGFVPLYEWQDMTIQKIKALQRGVAQKKALIGREKDIDNLFIKAESSLKTAAGFYARGVSDAQALQLALQKTVEKLSSDCDVEIKSTDWLPPSEGEIVQAPIRVRCEAPPDQLVKFISAIETGNLFRSLDKLTINSRPKASVIKATLDISAYGLRE